MKKIITLLGLVAIVACTAPGGNKDIIPEEHDPAHVPHGEGDEHGHGEGETHEKSEEAHEHAEGEAHEHGDEAATEHKEVKEGADKEDEHGH